MATIRERIADALLGDERKKLKEAVSIMADYRHYVVSPVSMLKQLGELDSRTVDLLLQQRGYRMMGDSAGNESWNSESARLEAVAESRRMFHMDVLVRRSVAMWTDFGFGQKPNVQPRDEALAEVWTDFWEARRNKPLLKARKVHELSNALVKDGELFLVGYISTLDGSVTLRKLPTEKIKTLVTDPDDEDVVLYYGQETPDGVVLYPNWEATEADLERAVRPDGAKTIDEIMAAKRDNQATKAVVLHVAVNEQRGRGWPQLQQALVWARTYKDFLGDRAAVARAVAMYVDKVKVKGGQRAVDDVRARLESALARGSGEFGSDRNPPAVAGSDWIQNDAVDRERMPLSTGAGDAQTDGMTLAAQFAAGAGVPLHWLGRADAMQNRAVARESALPWYEQIQRYQDLWRDVFGDLVALVGWAKETYGQEAFETMEADVTLDSVFDADVAETVALMTAVNAAVKEGTLDGAAGEAAVTKLVEISLMAVGVREAGALLAPQPPSPALPPKTGEGGNTEAELYSGGGTVITDEDVKRAIKKGKAKTRQFVMAGV